LYKLHFDAVHTVLALVFLLSFIVVIPSMSRVIINATKKTVVVILLATEKTFVTFVVISDKSGKLFKIVIIPKFST